MWRKEEGNQCTAVDNNYPNIFGNGAEKYCIVCEFKYLSTGHAITLKLIKSAWQIKMYGCFTGNNV